MGKFGCGMGGLGMGLRFGFGSVACIYVYYTPPTHNSNHFSLKPKLQLFALKYWLSVCCCKEALSRATAKSEHNAPVFLVTEWVMSVAWGF